MREKFKGSLEQCASENQKFNTKHYLKLDQEYYNQNYNYKEALVTGTSTENDKRRKSMFPRKTLQILHIPSTSLYRNRQKRLTQHLRVFPSGTFDWGLGGGGGLPPMSPMSPCPPSWMGGTTHDREGGKFCGKRVFPLGKTLSTSQTM